MILAAIEWLPIIINLLLVLFVLVCLLMTLLILMQRPKQEGLGAAFGAGVTDQVFGARTTNVLQRGTVYLGSMFFILSLTLAILIGHQNKQKTLTKAPSKAPVQAEKNLPAKPTSPTSPTSPASPTEPAPVSPPAPAEPIPAPVAPPAPVEPTPAPVTPPAPVEPIPAPVTPPAPTEPTPAPEPVTPP